MPELLYQQHQQTPINGRISGMAPPGNETGYYYIPIANLPWQTSWQELKDHVRTVCSVEHVEINEDTASGHVVLKGRANFDAAFRLLNGGIFHERALIADGRNADCWVLVKQQVDGPTSSSQSPKSRYTAPPAQYSSTQAAPSYSEWPASSPGSSYMVSPVINSSSGLVPSAMPEYRNPAIPYASFPDYTQQYVPREGMQYYADAVSTKRRKIIIRQLQPWANEAQIRDLIHHKAGSDAAERLQKLDVPLADGQQGSNRGYAIATFETEDGADKVIRRLNNYQYDGRVLEAKFTKEGVSDHEPSHGSRSHGSSHHRHSYRECRDEKDKKGKNKEGSHKAASSSEKKSKPSKSDVIIANGSSYSYV